MSNDADIQDLEDAKKRALIENTAQAIYKHLQDLEDKKSLVMSRWVWELLQNARDAAPKGDDIKVFLSAQQDKLIFRHSGAPFTNEEISHLIYHGSTKHQGAYADPIGHFGSGFISTHLISKCIQISGSMISGRRFSFSLDREAESPAALSQVMDRSWEEFKASLRSDLTSVDGGFSTEYVYALTPDTAKPVDAGVSALLVSAPYVMAFNPKLLQIEVETGEEIIRVSKSPARDVATGVRVVEVESRSSTGHNNKCYVVLTSEDDVSVAALLVAKDGSLGIETLPQVPKIFVAFPLYGTDDFAFPAVINGAALKPTEERDGVFLGRSDSEGNRANMAMMQIACRLLLRLISVATDQGWEGTHSLAYVGRVAQKTWLDDKWYEALVKEELIDKVRVSLVLINAAGEHIQPCNAWIPLATGTVSRDALWDVTKSLRHAVNKLPRRSDFGAWSDVLVDWASHLSVNPEGLAEGWILSKLAGYVAGLGSLVALDAQLGEGNDPIAWLNHVHGLIIDAGLTVLFDDMALLPDQLGVFKKRNALLRDGGIDERLKDICGELSIDVRGSLLHLGISTTGVKALLSGERKEIEVLEQAVKALQKKAEGTLAGSALDASISLLNWIVEHGYHQHLLGFPVITESYGEGAHETLSLPSGGAPEREDLPLAPVQQWPESSRPFVDLFPRRFVLNSEHYADAVPARVWQTLAARGHIRFSPVHESRSITQDFLPEDVPDSSEGTTHRSTAPVAQSTIAFLKKNDIGLIDTARKSRAKSIQLLKFILGPALSEDDSWSETPSAGCECGQSHRYFKAGWLPVLKELRWVYLGRNRSTHPTAESIAGLAETDEGLRRGLSSEKATELIRSLGISPAELSLRSFAKDEDTRVTLIRSLSNISEATGGDMNRVVALANAVKDDPTLIELVEERVQVRDRVRHNQAVGQSVEELLTAALAAKGLHVTRTGIGSDYEVESDFVENSQEILLTISGGKKSYLIEIKATTGTSAKMTAKQAETASANKDGFVLCMVRLSGSQVSEKAISAGA